MGCDVNAIGPYIPILPSHSHDNNPLLPPQPTPDPGSHLPYPIVVSALRGEPKPGYGLKSSTLPAAGRNGGPAGMIVSKVYNDNLIKCTLFSHFLWQ